MRFWMCDTCEEIDWLISIQENSCFGSYPQHTGRALVLDSPPPYVSPSFSPRAGLRGRQLQGVTHLMPFTLINPLPSKPGSPATPCQIVAVIPVATTVRLVICFGVLLCLWQTPVRLQQLTLVLHPTPFHLPSLLTRLQHLCFALTEFSIKKKLTTPRLTNMIPWLSVGPINYPPGPHSFWIIGLFIWTILFKWKKQTNKGMHLHICTNTIVSVKCQNLFHPESLCRIQPVGVCCTVTFTFGAFGGESLIFFLISRPCSDLHIPPVNTVVARRREDVMNSFIIQTPSVSEEGQQGGSAGGKDRAVVTNEGISKWYDLPHASFIHRTAEVHKQGWRTAACFDIDGVCEEARGGRTPFDNNHGNMPFRRWLRW